MAQGGFSLSANFETDEISGENAAPPNPLKTDVSCRGGNRKIKMLQIKFKPALALIATCAIFASLLMASPASAGEDKVHKLVLQVNEDNWKKINMALNNATNVIKYYGIGNVEVEIVAYGPGLAMFHKSSKVQKRLQSINAFGNVKFAVCGNTMKKMKLTKNDLLADAFIQKGVVPSGVVRLIQLQEKGWSYVRP